MKNSSTKQSHSVKLYTSLLFRLEPNAGLSINSVKKTSPSTNEIPLQAVSFQIIPSSSTILSQEDIKRNIVLMQGSLHTSTPMIILRR